MSRFNVTVTVRGDDGEAYVYLRGEDRVALAKRAGPCLTALDKIIGELTEVAGQGPVEGPVPSEDEPTRRKTETEEAASAGEGVDLGFDDEEPPKKEEPVPATATLAEVVTALRKVSEEKGKTVALAVLKDIGGVASVKALDKAKFADVCVAAGLALD